jgi:uncharacterized small protein (TIGR04563 family)
MISIALWDCQMTAKSHFGGDRVTSLRVLGIVRCMTEDMNKQSLYFPIEVLNEIGEEAKRLERSKSWVVTHAWKLARSKIKKMSASDPGKH